VNPPQRSGISVLLVVFRRIKTAAQPAALHAMLVEPARESPAGLLHSLKRAISMTANVVWKNVFNNWPTGIPRRGMVISTLNEPMPFKGFMVKDDVVLLERTNPDALGARFILLSFEAINCVKLTDPLKESAFASAGFLGKFATV
jgi:hypothetical protein